jgi:adenosine deaminase
MKPLKLDEIILGRLRLPIWSTESFAGKVAPGPRSVEYALQDLRALRAHIEDRDTSLTDVVGEIYAGFQSAARIDNRLNIEAVGFPSLIANYWRLPIFRANHDMMARPYEVFAKNVMKVARGANVNWNHFGSNFPDDERHINLYNIQLGNETLWHNLLKVIASKASLKNQFFVFYWLPPPNCKTAESTAHFKTIFERKDRLWSYSRFLRDFLCAHGKGIEVSLGTDRIQLGLDRLDTFVDGGGVECTPQRHFGKVDENVSASLQSVYGEAFRWTPQTEEVAKLYIHNKSNHSDLGGIQDRVISHVISADVGDHGVLGALDNQFASYVPPDAQGVFLNRLGAHVLWSHFLKTMSSLTSSYVLWKSDLPVSFLCIDDNPDGTSVKLRALRSWFPDGSVGYLQKDKWANLIRSVHPLAELKPEDIEPLDSGAKRPAVDEVTFLLIDLEYQGEPRGFELLRKLRSETRDKKKPLVITLSRRDDAESIQRSLNSGALFHVTKSHFFDIIPAVSQVWTHIQELRVEDKIRYAEYENWHLLSKLPLRKQLELQSTQVLGEEYDPGKEKRWITGYKSSVDYQWIQKFPKADIHCHIGSCMGPELLPQTAMVVLAELLNSRPEYEERIQAMIEFVLPIASDPFLNEGNKPDANNERPSTKEYKKSFGFRDKKGKSIFEVIQDAYSLKERDTLPEVALLDPLNDVLDEKSRWHEETYSTSYFQNKRRLQDLGVTYDEVMLVFVLLLYCRDSGDYDCSVLHGKMERLRDQHDTLRTDDMKEALERVGAFVMIFKKRSKEFEEEFKMFRGTSVDDATRTIRFLQSAHSMQRCLQKGESSLFNYLRGCEYGGSPHLQTKASIFLAIRSIVFDYAIRDKIRYLCLRCSVDGYKKLGLIKSDEQAMEHLLAAIKLFTKEACQNRDCRIRINVIVTAKRHKSFEEFDNNVRLALKFGKRESFQDSPTFPGIPRVVSFDLAGLEKGNPPEKFLKHFQPLIDACFPITIHAGEETGAEVIHQAVYKVFSQRIGHGLSLRSRKDLQDTVRERHIAVELCPISNFLTSGKYTFRQYKTVGAPTSSWDYEKSDSYPLRQYLDENLDVTINTDNPFISNSALTEEYLAAARVIGGLTKWEILRLIKNGFRAAAIPKDEKRQLMNEIDDEIYELLLNED